MAVLIASEEESATLIAVVSEATTEALAPLVSAMVTATDSEDENEFVICDVPSEIVMAQLSVLLIEDCDDEASPMVTAQVSFAEIWTTIALVSEIVMADVSDVGWVTATPLASVMVTAAVSVVLDETARVLDSDIVIAGVSEPETITVPATLLTATGPPESSTPAF